MGKVPESLLLTALIGSVVFAFYMGSTGRVWWALLGVLLVIFNGITLGARYGEEARRQTQACIDKGGHWADYNGMKICVDKDERILR